MKNLILFWKKDIINKLIIVTSLALLAGVVAFILMLFNMPQGKSLTEAISEIFPLPATSDPDSILTMTPAVTETPLPFNIGQPPPTTDGIVVEIPPTLTEAFVLPTLTLEQFTSVPQATSTSVVTLNADCIPRNASKVGKAVSVLDGNTINVLVDGLVYVVRYIGVAAPEDKILADKARLENAKLVFGKEIVLIADQSDKDARGRLLRYVMVDDTFVNLKMLQQGLGFAVDTPPDSSCAQTFKQAEQLPVPPGTPSGIFGATATATPEP